MARYTEAMRHLPLLGLLACNLSGSADLSVPGTNPILAQVSIEAAPAVDPIQGPLPWFIQGPAGSPATVEVIRDGQVLWSDSGTLTDGVWEGTWDGVVEDELAPSGPVTVRATASTGTAEAPSVVVRAGFIAAWAEDDDGLTATRSTLFWRGDRIEQDQGLPFASVDRIQDFTPVTEDLLFPPADGETEPVAYTADSRPILVFEVPTQTELGETGLEFVDLTVAADGWSVLDEGPLAPGSSVHLQRDEPLADTVGITDTELQLQFQAEDALGQVWTVGEQVLPLKVYRVLDEASFGHAADHYSPWTIVLEESLAAIEGTPAEHDAILDALVAWIYNDLGLVYDTNNGASFYSEYEGFSWDQPHFYLTEFLTRANGSVINCSDSGNILSAYSNMLGADLQHIVILENYDLNEIKAIGQPDYTSCPFGPWGCGFSYHAVTTWDDGSTIWDTTLALDGDANPGQSPSTELLVQSIAASEYLDRLVRSGSANYAYPSQMTME